MQTVRNRVLGRIKRLGRGSTFSAKDLSEVAARGTIDVTLSRLVSEAVIRRIGRSLYDYPRENKLLGELEAPSIDQAVQTIARKHRWTIAPHGAMAANLLFLSTQVPARVVYLSDGPTRQVVVGKLTIKFQHVSPKDIHAADYLSRTIIQALKHLGKPHVSQKTIDHLRRILPRKERAALVRDTRYGTDWVHEVARKIAEDRKKIAEERKDG